VSTEVDVATIIIDGVEVSDDIEGGDSANRLLDGR